MTASYQGIAGSDAAATWPTRPKLGLLDYAALLFRQLPIMILVGAVIALVGLAGVMLLRPTYTAEARLLVLLGQEYVFRPRVGEESFQLNSPGQEEIIQSEIEILTSRQLAERVIRRVGMETIFPTLAEDTNATMTPEKRMGAAVRAFNRAFSAGTAPNTTVIRAEFKNEDAAASAIVLNTLLDEYLTYRREVLLDNPTAAFARQREEVEARLRAIDTEITSFLSENKIGDFMVEQETLGDIYARNREQLQAAQADRRQADARLAEVRSRLNQMPQQITLQNAVEAERQLVALELERQDLLARYTPESRTVREIEDRITRARSILDTPEGRDAGTRTIGVNPNYLELNAERIRLEAEVRSLAARENTLAAQLADTERRQINLTALRSRHDELTRERDILGDTAKRFATREEEARADNELARTVVDNIRIIQRATTPTQGTSLRLPIFAAVLAFAALTALAVGLARALLHRGFPTAAAAQRSIGVPVLAAVPRR